MLGSLPWAEALPPKLRTARAVARLCWAQLLVSLIPFKHWHYTLGLIASGREPPDSVEIAKSHAADVEWAAGRLPLTVKCLPRAMALSWILRRERVAHAVVFAVRPAALRDLADALHAWVEVEGEKVLGDLPGPWIETARFNG